MNTLNIPDQYYRWQSISDECDRSEVFDELADMLDKSRKDHLHFYAQGLNDDYELIRCECVDRIVFFKYAYLYLNKIFHAFLFDLHLLVRAKAVWSIAEFLNKNYIKVIKKRIIKQPDSYWDSADNRLALAFLESELFGAKKIASNMLNSKEIDFIYKYARDASFYTGKTDKHIHSRLTAYMDKLKKDDNFPYSDGKKNEIISYLERSITEFENSDFYERRFTHEVQRF